MKGVFFYHSKIIFMKTIRKVSVLISVFLVILASCRKETFDNSLQAPRKLPVELQFTDKQKNEARDKFAKALALAARQKEVREFLKVEALKKFNGDTEILYEMVKNKKVIGEKTFATILVEALENGISMREDYGTFFNTYLSLVEPTMTIAVEPGQTSTVPNWNTNQVSMVAVAYTYDDDATTRVLNAYDANGNLRQISGIETPLDVTIVVRHNERVVAVNRASGLTPSGTASTLIAAEACFEPQRAFYINGVYDFFLMESLLACSGSGLPLGGSLLGGGGGPAAGNCDRDMKDTKDEMNDYTFESWEALRNVESWWYGVPEMYFYAYWARTNTSNSNATLENVRKMIRSEESSDMYFTSTGSPLFRQKNIEIINWQQTTFSDVMKYTWMEQDNTDFSVDLSIKLAVPLSGAATAEVGATVKISSNDDPAGDSIIEYCDPANTPGDLYTTGSVKFHVRQRE
jgi:hypothetical protein